MLISTKRLTWYNFDGAMCGAMELRTTRGWWTLMPYKRWLPRRWWSWSLTWSPDATPQHPEARAYGPGKFQ